MLPEKPPQRASTIMTVTATKPEGPTGDFDGDIDVSNKLPSKEDLEKVADLPVLDVAGKPHPFSTLHSRPDGSTRTLIIFVRHFFCGVSDCPTFDWRWRTGV